MRVLCLPNFQACDNTSKRKNKTKKNSLPSDLLHLIISMLCVAPDAGHRTVVFSCSDADHRTVVFSCSVAAVPGGKYM